MNTADVHVDIDGVATHAGTAHFTRRHRSLTTAFQYRREYLADPRSYALDPQLPLFIGQHATSGLPPAFSDCAPDRWGRNLITKRIQAQARTDHRTPPTIDDVDFVQSVSDLTRQGALRFSEPGGPFLATDDEIPKLVELPALLAASDALARGDDDFMAIKVLLGAGTGTLGGARPKASVRDDHRLHVAKFPKPSDDWDVMAWEATALDLAQRAGIRTPPHRIATVTDRHVLLVQRFDRTNEDGRIGYWSAMTLLQTKDDVPADYIDLAEAMTEHSMDTTSDLEQLWRRIAFSVAINNTDDHLRNHGFLRGVSGWGPSPAFDINPNPDTSEARATSIGGLAIGIDQLDALMEFRSTFGLAEHRSRVVLSEVFDATAGWEQSAANNGVPIDQIRRFTAAFEQHRDNARRLASRG